MNSVIRLAVVPDAHHLAARRRKAMIGEMSMRYYLAIDIGASSGRHIAAWRDKNGIQMKEVYRFKIFPTAKTDISYGI